MLLWNFLTRRCEPEIVSPPIVDIRTVRFWWRVSVSVYFSDKKNQLILDEVQNRGTVDHAPVYPREVVRRALELSASALILVHNHPSGDPTPSRADIEITKQVVQAGRALNVEVHDHLVVGRDGVASFKQLGLM